VIIIQNHSGDRAEAWAMAEGGEIVGQLEVRAREYAYGRGPADRRYAEITSLTVEPAHRRSGIGAGLVDAAMRWAAFHGYSHVAVESTARQDRPGPPFYAALGFEQRAIIWDVAVPEPDS
jgi:GNAT superfamily N-acetyltransferase